MTWDLYPDEKGGQRVSQVHRGNGYGVAGVTGTIAAALAQDSLVYAMRCDPALVGIVEIRRVRLQWTTIVAFTTPITAGRQLGIYRAAGAATSGGAALAAVALDTAGAGAGSGLSDVRIATTAALGVAGVVREANARARMTAVHVGAAGVFFEELYEFYGESAPFELNPGELMVVSNPVAMDAAGTWQLGVTVDYQVCGGRLVK